MTRKLQTPQAREKMAKLERERRAKKAQDDAMAERALESMREMTRKHVLETMKTPPAQTGRTLPSISVTPGGVMYRISDNTNKVTLGFTEHHV